MNYLFYSSSETYEAGVQRIHTEAQAQNQRCKIVELADASDAGILSGKEAWPLQGYFLTNDSNIPQYIESLKRHRFLVVNEHFLLNNTSKFTVQQKLSLSGMTIPKSISALDAPAVRGITYPIYVKTTNHGGAVTYIKESLALNKTLAHLDLNDYYIEEAVEQRDMLLHKCYYINGICFIGEESSTICRGAEWFLNVLKRISRCLELTVFSADVFVDWSTNQYLCIDVNPAPAFFRSNSARKEFVRQIFI